MSRSIALSAAGLALLVVAVPSMAAHIYCAATGVTQGLITGTATAAGYKGQIPVLAFMQEITVPTEGSTGIAGRAQSQPFTITKAVDLSSPQFFQAAITGETFKSVVCQLIRETGNGEGHAYFRITLTNALITDLKDGGDGVNGSAEGDDRERISFAFQKIELTDLDSNQSVSSSAR